MNQIVYWSRLLDWKNQTLTPNPDVIYAMPFFDTCEVGPMVLEIPPAGDDGSITGTIMDCWQAALEDVGPAGMDKGKGGKYLILPPGLRGRSAGRVHRLALRELRGLCAAALDPEERQRRDVARGRRLREAHHAVSALAGDFAAADHLRRRDRRRVRQHDPVRPALLPIARPHRPARALARPRQGDDRRAAHDRHREGQAVSPRRRHADAPQAAALEAHASLDARYEGRFEPFYDDAHWSLPFLPELGETVPTGYEKADAYSVDARGLADSYAFSPVKYLGAGQAYLMTIADAEGNPLDGSMRIGFSCRRTRPSGSTGPPSPTTARRMR